MKIDLVIQMLPKLVFFYYSVASEKKTVFNSWFTHRSWTTFSTK